jgi:aminopeptidase N
MSYPIFWFFLFFTHVCFAQGDLFHTKQDSLRGTITPERSWWDLIHYDLSVTIDTDQRHIEGQNTLTYKVRSLQYRMQIDLQKPMRLLSVVQDKDTLSFEQDGNAYFIKLKKRQTIGKEEKITLRFSGTPKTSSNPPWDAGFTWENDKNNRAFVGVSCQGGGASIWWPCKDHLYDEPDRGISLHYTVPNTLSAIGNGNLLGEEHHKKSNQKTYHWKVSNPINNYAVHLSIGDYSHFSDAYTGEKGTLNCNYFVLKDHLKKAKNQFVQAHKTLEAFEHWFGPYPFYADGFKLVEVPFLGMEHQSAVCYGNAFQNGYKGRDLSGTGWGLLFDYIIVHEMGHEWFGNNITNKDIADLWIHESFTCYSESLYLEYHHGKNAGQEYLIGLRKDISNQFPIIGVYGVNKEGSSDMYSKGANLLNTLRTWIDNDRKWRLILRGLNREFFHQTVTTSQIEKYLSQEAGIDFSNIFDQYLRHASLPILEYQVQKKRLRYRWKNSLPNFDMPLLISIDQEKQWIHPTNDWTTKKTVDAIKSVEIDPNFYIEIEKTGA